LTDSELENYANQCGLNQLLHMDGVEGCLEHFADLIAQHEREECAKIADQYVGQDLEHNFSALVAHNIRVRGQA
jgi:hypothetical protein